MSVRIGLVGCGNISDTHARAAREVAGAELVAYWGRDPAKASAMAQRYGGKPYRGLDEFLAHRRMDVVVVGTPSGVHAEHAQAAARQGLHVLVEKPLDVTTARIDGLTAECDGAGVKLGVIYQDRAAPDLIWLKQLITGGGLGRPIIASGRVPWYRPPEYYAGSRWRGTWGLDGGGALMNQGIHTVDLLLWLLGDVDRVYATTRTALHTIAVEDTAVACLEFANGAVGTLEATTAAFPGLPRRVELTGSEGTIVVERDRVVSAQLRCLDAAGVAARLAARGELTADVESVAHAAAPPDARLTLSRTGDVVSAAVAARVHPLGLGALLPAFSVEASAVAPMEPGQPGR